MTRRRLLVLGLAAAAIPAGLGIASVAAPAQPRVALRVVVPPGRGSVAAGSLSCAATCTWTFPRGTRVALHENAAMGFRFARWSGVCTGSGACAVVLKRSRNVSGRFVPLPRNVSWNPHTSCAAIPTTIEAVLGSQRSAAGGAIEAGGAFSPHFRGYGQIHQLDPACAVGGEPTLVEIDDLVVDDKIHQVEDDDWVGGLTDPSRPDIQSRYLKRVHVEIDETWVNADAAPLPPPAVGQHVDVQGFVFWDPGHLGNDWHAFSGWELHPLAAWRPAVHQ